MNNKQHEQFFAGVAYMDVGKGREQDVEALPFHVPVIKAA